ncbi:MAG: N-acyl homoserine lactonase family protein [Candidatus Dormibacteraeota bacterium]|nr:N-acyl homoserine lactonase family protein [Candidatus Dormibacteraeota bacterium]
MKIHPIQTGTVAIRQTQIRGSGPGPVRRLRPLVSGAWTDPPTPILAWVIEHPEGVIVVDTGELARAARPGYFPWWHPYFKRAARFAVDPEEEVGPRLKGLGLSPDDVRWVVITHLHTDHAGGLGYFPKVEVVISRGEYLAARSPLATLNGYLQHHWPAWLEPRLVGFEGTRRTGGLPSVPLTKAEDVVLVSTPGHTAGHMSVVALNGAAPVFMAGDVSYLEATLMEEAVDSVAPDAGVARQTLAVVKRYVTETGAAYLPTHDPGSKARLAAAVAAG